MSKVDIISGFLGAGKTTLIKKLINECFKNEKIVLIENEFGEIGIDGGFLKEAGIEITEMNSGCICCSLVGDFSQALVQVVETYHPDRIIIEPSGVGKLSDVIKAVLETECDDISTWKSNGYKYIKTDKYKAIRGGNISFEKILINISNNFNNDILEIIKPYNFKDLEEFNKDNNN